MLDPQEYLDLVSPQHIDKPDFIAVLMSLLQPIVDLQTSLAYLPDKFDIDTATGVQLDTIGEWLNRSRNISTPIDNVYFSFDIAGIGFDQGLIFGPYVPATGITSLDDEHYRLLLYAKIAADNWDGTTTSANIILANLISPDLFSPSTGVVIPWDTATALDSQTGADSFNTTRTGTDVSFGSPSPAGGGIRYTNGAGLNYVGKSNVLAAKAGQTYTISFYFRRTSGATNTGFALAVFSSARGVNVASVPMSSVPNDTVWRQYSVSFVASVTELLSVYVGNNTGVLSFSVDQILLTPTNPLLFMQDNEDMTAWLGIAGPWPSHIALALIQGGYINLRAAGVTLRYAITSVDGAPLFGFDMRNQYIGGFDVGAIAQTS